MSRSQFCQSVFVFLLSLMFGGSGPDLFAQSTASREAQTENDLGQNSNLKPPTGYWPEGVACDPGIPTPEQFFGFDIGVRHLTHDQVVGYAREIARISDRVSVQQYGMTHGQRPLMLLTITSQQNRRDLKQIRTAHRQLAKANSSRVSLDDLPAVINMGYGVHGDESSATNGAMLVLHYLASAQGDEIESWLQNCVILLDPSLNPDGFNRFANWANRYRGRVPNPDPQHAEHHQMWPPGRVNYYWFDLNRDWLPLVHPESRGRMGWYHQWKPNVVLDFHEMGTNSTFFFQPGIPERTNPLTPARNMELTRAFGRYHADALDQQGRLYFTQERFDDFYMGKGSTYPDLHGSVGILFEQASSRGHVQRNQDGLLRFHDTIANHFTTSLSSLRATSEMRTELLEYKKTFYENSVEAANRHPIKTYVFSCPHNRTRLEAFANVLLRHDIQCYWLKEAVAYGDRNLDPRWSLVVPVVQPEFKFLQSLLMRRTNFKENIFYDVSAWTLPLAYGVDQLGLKNSLDMAKLEPAKIQWRRNVSAPGLSGSEEAVAYLVDWRDDAAPKLLKQLLAAGANVRVAKQPFSSPTITGREQKFGYGTLSVPVGVQPQQISKIRSILEGGIQSGAVVTAIKSGLSTRGPDLGSSNFPVIQKPRIAMLTGTGVSPYGAGEIWYLLDHEINLPVTLLKQSRLAQVELSDYTRLILPGGSLDEADWKIVSDYASSGGTVIAIGSASNDVAGKLGVLGSPDVVPQIESADKEAGLVESPIHGTVIINGKEVQKPFDSAADERALRLISGAIFKTRIDRTHPLLFGFSKDTLAVFRSHASFLKPSESPYRNPAVYDADEPLMAGYCSSENVEKFKGSASLVVHPVGRGHIILMSENPNFRGFWKASSRVFLNAIFFGNLID